MNLFGYRKFAALYRLVLRESFVPLLTLALQNYFNEFIANN